MLYLNKNECREKTGRRKYIQNTQYDYLDPEENYAQ